MKLMLGCLLSLCSLFAYSADTLTINAKSNQFVVTLPSNPTTGYQWTATRYNKNLFHLLTSRYKAPQSKLMGAGGQMTFTFALNKGKSYPQQTPMVFTYARPWESKNGTVKPITIRFIK